MSDASYCYNYNYIVYTIDRKFKGQYPIWNSFQSSESNLFINDREEMSNETAVYRQRIVWKDNYGWTIEKSSPIIQKFNLPTNSILYWTVTKSIVMNDPYKRYRLERFLQKTVTNKIICVAWTRKFMVEENIKHNSRVHEVFR